MSKWTRARRAKLSASMKAHHAMKKISPPMRVKQSSHFYRLVGAELKPVKVKKIVAWVIE